MACRNYDQLTKKLPIARSFFIWCKIDSSKVVLQQLSTQWVIISPKQEVLDWIQVLGWEWIMYRCIVDYKLTWNMRCAFSPSMGCSQGWHASMCITLLIPCTYLALFKTYLAFFFCMKISILEMMFSVINHFLALFFCLLCTFSFKEALLMPFTTISKKILCRDLLPLYHVPSSPSFSLLHAPTSITYYMVLSPCPFICYWVIPQHWKITNVA